MAPPAPLADVRILDLAGESAVFAARILGELGADVIRVEPPGGDTVRGRPPFLGDEPGLERGLHHLHFNVNKRSLTLDVRAERGAELLRRLAGHVDVVIETEPPGAMDALGVGYEALRAENPGLLYTTITPFGQEGPMSSYRGADIVGTATSGLMWLNGYPDDPPNHPGGEQAYHMASMVAASTTLVALVGRDRRGAGRRIDVSIQEATSMATLQHASPNVYTWMGGIPKRYGMTAARGGRHLFPCADGVWMTVVITPYRWGDFLDWLDAEGIPSELRDPQWLDYSHRMTHTAPIAEAIERLCAARPSEYLFHEGQRRHQLMMPVNGPAELLADEQLRHGEYFVDLEYDHLGRTLTDTGTTFAFSGLAAGLFRRAPRLGEHTEEVLRELLDLDVAEIEALRTDGVV